MRITKVMLMGLMAGCAALALALAGCATMKEEAAKPAPARYLSCAVGGKVVTSVAPEAQLVSLECSQKKYDGANSLAVKITLKNVSSEDQRFRVNIFLDNGKAVGGLIPQKTKKGLVKPGATAAFTYFFKGQDMPPTSMELIVKAMAK
jgi:hypothetical protein